LTLFTLVNASGERKKPQMTPNVCRSSAELWPNSHMLPSRTFGRILRPSAEFFGRTSASAELRPISTAY